jgi:pyruvate dehydrogenase E2 component (dihydrolipoamide acetyltransferase)
MATQAVQTGQRISPYARRLAAQRGIPVADLVGTGPGGEVVAKDVRRAGRPMTGQRPTTATR